MIVFQDTFSTPGSPSFNGRTPDIGFGGYAWSATGGTVVGGQLAGVGGDDANYITATYGDSSVSTGLTRQITAFFKFTTGGSGSLSASNSTIFVLALNAFGNAVLAINCDVGGVPRWSIGGAYTSLSGVILPNTTYTGYLTARDNTVEAAISALGISASGSLSSDPPPDFNFIYMNLNESARLDYITISDWPVTFWQEFVNSYEVP